VAADDGQPAGALAERIERADDAGQRDLNQHRDAERAGHSGQVGVTRAGLADDPSRPEQQRREGREGPRGHENVTGRPSIGEVRGGWQRAARERVTEQADGVAGDAGSSRETDHPGAGARQHRAGPAAVAGPGPDPGPDPGPGPGPDPGPGPGPDPGLGPGHAPGPGPGLQQDDLAVGPRPFDDLVAAGCVDGTG
jgi:hypothetical protein